MMRSRFHFDLGLPGLVPEWRQLLSPRGLRDDLIAGTTVACIALPLSLAIALASGVHPSVGLVTAIVGSVVCALFGGTRLTVSGPAAAMAVLVASIVQQFGMTALLVVGLLCGLWQVLTGIFGLGNLVRYVPAPVVAGFTAGIGAIILIGQLPGALGLVPPDQSHVRDVITHLVDLIDETNPAALALSLTAVSITVVLPRLAPRWPAPLVAVIVPTVLAYALGMRVDVIGSMSSALPRPHLPPWPTQGWGELVGASLIVYAVASLETLLSASAADKLAKTTRHSPDQELIGQGLGNLASALFGGILVTGVIARSALNIQAGAKTRRAAIIHAAWLLLAVCLAGPIIAKIPNAVLAGVLLSVALRMLHPRELLSVWRTSQVEAVTYTVTFFTIVCVDLTVGVQAGVAAALAIAAFRLGRPRAKMLAQRFAQTEPEAPRRLPGASAAVDHLVHGVEKFRASLLPADGALFRRLAAGQSPHTLFITCSDSRIDPNLITSTRPGELFIVRNVGNLIPAFGTDDVPAEGAAVEFAIGVLGVKDIVVCGHSGCGAMGAILSGRFGAGGAPSPLPSLAKWLQRAAGLKDSLKQGATPEMAAAANAVQQLTNLQTYPLIQERIASGQLTLRAWYYDIGEARLEAWDATLDTFVELGSEAKRAFDKRVVAGVQFQAPFEPPTSE